MKKTTKVLLLLSAILVGTAYAEPTPVQVLGEQVDGSLMQPEEEPWMLTPAEVTNCDLNRASQGTSPGTSITWQATALATGHRRLQGSKKVTKPRSEPRAIGHGPATW